MIGILWENKNNILSFLIISRAKNPFLFYMRYHLSHYFLVYLTWPYSSDIICSILNGSAYWHTLFGPIAECNFWDYETIIFSNIPKSWRGTWDVMFFSHLFFEGGGKLWLNVLLDLNKNSFPVSFNTYLIVVGNASPNNKKLIQVVVWPLSAISI